MRLDKLKRSILSEISKPTQRGKQVKVGPSEIGGCPSCVGETLAHRVPEKYPDLKHEEDFGLGAWIGTAVHAHIENTFDIPGAIHERKLDIFELPGYGMIRGSCDFYHDGHVIDWKNPARYLFEKLRLEYARKPDVIPTTVYRVQQMLYGYGWLQAGYPVEDVSLCVIPKESNRLEDVKFFTEKYNQEVVDKALERLCMIYEYVTEGMLEDLPSDDDCYRCTRITYRAA